MRKILVAMLTVAPFFGSILLARTAVAESYFSFQIGGMFGVRGTNLTALENLNYPFPPPDKRSATGSNIALDSSVMVGFKVGRYFDSLPGFGIEFDGHYGRPDFKRQNVAIGLTNSTVEGFSSFVEDQRPAEVHVISGSLNLLYRLSQLGMVRPYLGAGPSFHVLPIRGSGDSGNVIAPAEFASPLIPGPSLNSTGTGFGFNLKAGLEIPIDDRFSVDAEYKYNYAYIKVDEFRSFSSAKFDYFAHILAAGLRLKF